MYIFLYLYNLFQTYRYMDKNTDFAETVNYNFMNLYRIIHNIVIYEYKYKGKNQTAAYDIKLQHETLRKDNVCQGEFKKRIIEKKFMA